MLETIVKNKDLGAEFPDCPPARRETIGIAHNCRNASQSFRQQTRLISCFLLARQQVPAIRNQNSTLGIFTAISTCENADLSAFGGQCARDALNQRSLAGAAGGNVSYADNGGVEF